MYESRQPTLVSRGWSGSNLFDMESRYSRGRSEERYPVQYRGRSPSPMRRTVRSHSLEPEVYERESSPVREVAPFRRSVYVEPPRYDYMRPYSDYYPYCSYYNFNFYDRPYSHYYRPTPYIPTYDPRPYYNDYSCNLYTRPRSTLYSYSKPCYSRLSPETRLAIAGISRANTDQFLTPRDRSYSTTTPYESYSLTSPGYIKSFSTYTSSDSQVYNPTKYRSYYAHPIKRARSRDLCEVKAEGAEAGETAAAE